MPAPLLVRAAELAREIVALRRRLHRCPEVGLHLPATRAVVLAALSGLPLEIVESVDSSSITAVLRGRRLHGEPRSVLLRADMDALPISEQTGLAFASRGGAMHACGHDMHTAGLVGAARLLCAVREQLDGDVVFMFQAGEEGHGGARLMLDAGVLEAAGSRVRAAFAAHVLPDLDTGVVALRPGPQMAAYSTLGVEVHGAGGHGARPHQAADPVPVVAELVTALHTHVNRRADPLDPVVLTVGRLRAGDAPNVIPAEAELAAGLRYHSNAGARLVEALPELARKLVDAHGLRAVTRLEHLFPPLTNDPVAVSWWAECTTELFGPERFRTMPEPRTSSDDFAHVLRHVPGAYGFLGAAPVGSAAGPPAPNHSPHAVFDESVLTDLAALLAALAIRGLAAR